MKKEKITSVGIYIDYCTGEDRKTFLYRDDFAPSITKRQLLLYIYDLWKRSN